MQVDASDVYRFSEVMARAPKRLGDEVAKELNTGATLGITTARGFINSRSGTLAGAIRQKETASAGSLVASYSVSKGDVVYALQREYGGVIRAKKKFLVFPGRSGGLVFAKQVSQRGSQYMHRSIAVIRPRVLHGVAGAVHRVIASLGG